MYIIFVLDRSIVLKETSENDLILIAAYEKRP